MPNTLSDTLQVIINRTQSTLDSLKTAISSINSTPNEETGSILSEWLNIPIKIFGYSSIQVKVFASITALIIFFIIKKIIQKYAVNKIKDVKIRYRWQKILSYTSFTLSAIIIGQIWFKGIQSIATYLGFVSAGIAIALKDPIVNLVGWQYIVWKKPFDVGERVEIGQKSGDVIDITPFNFTIMEIGNWVSADESTGRIVHIPNGQVFTQPLANYGKGFQYIWNEISVLITFESNWQEAKSVLEKISSKRAAHLSEPAEKRVMEASKKFMITDQRLDPKVFTRILDSGIHLTIRYLCTPIRRRSSEQHMWEDILIAFSQYDDIDFAYPTIRRYLGTEEGKTLRKNIKKKDKDD